MHLQNMLWELDGRNLEGISKILKESNFTLLGRKVRGKGKWMANFTLDPPKPIPTRLRRKHDGKV